MAEPTPAQSKKLWMSFLQEWKEEAQEKGSKSAYVYSAAQKGLKENSAQFRHPKDLIIVKGIGASIIDKMTKALSKWCIENGEQMPSSGE